MELRILEYFLAVAREHNITRAAERLHITQPTLSRQLTDLENELGKQLLIRGKRNVSLTEDGIFFRRRAEEIINLAQRTKAEIKNTDENLTGDIYIGSGESASIRHIIRIAHNIQKEHPGIRFHFTSGDSVDLNDRLEKGLLDFCILFGDFDQSKYDYIPLPHTEKWGVLMPNDSHLSSKKYIDPSDLSDKPLVVSRQAVNSSSFLKWFGKPAEELNIINTYNLVYNATIMADEGMGYILTLKDLVNTEGTNLCFREFKPALMIKIALVWNKHQAHNRAAKKFIETLNNYFNP